MIAILIVFLIVVDKHFVEHCQQFGLWIKNLFTKPTKTDTTEEFDSESITNEEDTPDNIIDIILDESGFDALAAYCDLLVTGEGRLDFQSADGKVISGVAKRAAKLGKKVIAICGSRGEGAEKILDCGVSQMYFALEKEKPFDEILKTCKADLYNAAFRAADCFNKKLNF